MKTSKKQVKPRKKIGEACASLTLTHPKKTGNLEKTKNSETEKVCAVDSTNPKQTGRAYPTWEIHNTWPDLFTIFKMSKNDKEWIYQVSMADSLNARFSALGRGDTNLEAAKLYDALFRLHLCQVEENEFGSASELILRMEHEDSPGLAQFDAFSIKRLQDLLKAVELLKCSLSSELAELVYTESSAASAIDKLRKRFAKALKLLSAYPHTSAKKKSIKYYPYRNKQVSLPWLAIRLAHLFVIEHRRLPTKIELRESVGDAVRQEVKKIVEAAQARNEAALARRKTAKAALAEKEAALAREEVALAREEVALAREEVALAREEVALAREELALSREELALSREEVALARNEVEQAAAIAANMKESISRSTWSDTFKTTGLLELPEGPKFSASRNKKKPALQNAHSPSTAEKEVRQKP